MVRYNTNANEKVKNEINIRIYEGLRGGNE